MGDTANICQTTAAVSAKFVVKHAEAKKILDYTIHCKCLPTTAAVSTKFVVKPAEANNTSTIQSIANVCQQPQQ